MIVKTTKIMLAATLSYALAEMLHLEYASAAAIVAIISVVDTRKSTIKIGIQRVASMVLALTIASVVFSLFGYSLVTFALYLLIFVPLAYAVGVDIGIAPSSVLVSHLLMEGSVSWPILFNESLLMLIGAGLAILLNTYMPSKRKLILQQRQEIEEMLRHVLLAVSDLLQHGQQVGRFDRLPELRQMIQQAKHVVYQEKDNQLFTQTNYDVHYLDMRQNQEELLQGMVKNLALCHLTLDESKLLASIFTLTAEQLSERNTAVYLLQDIELLLEEFRNRALPKTREEFETRAILYQLLHDLTHFIQLKVDFYNEYATEWNE